ncbi:aldehyde dehydrogenase family protein [Winogradskyella sp. A3E31]|uniref:aldehyde dehydrogenase family protein n=1 Tax=Winogradskyella sp. A3E31 TaxID=3349637 RepID=UPI00398A7ABB
MTKGKDNRYQNLFETQKARRNTIGVNTYKERINKLNQLQTALTKTYKSEIRAALHADFKKPHVETDLTEIYLVVAEIKYAKKNLHRWMRRQKVETPIALIGTSSYYYFEPKGICLIISPWNYPFNLTMSPLVAAIAAGCSVIIKPSELTPNSSRVMINMIKELFDEDEVALIEGGIEVSEQLLALSFNHIFFTGSPIVGKIVMKAASKHLASVTLELGGKSPTIIDKSADLKLAARTIVWTKFLNNGQTCIAPDYVLIDTSVKSEFIEHCKTYIKKYYGDDPEKSSSYSRVVNSKHFDRLKDYLKETKNRNATFELGGDVFAEEYFIGPTIISNLPEDSKLLHEEVFGPILSIVEYSTLAEAINYINAKEKPLALYLYSKSNKTIEKVLSETRVGSTGINNAALQFSNHYLPFGGINNSGIGKSHGFFGFEEFSNKRSVLKRNYPGFISLMRPPYTKFVQKLVDITIKWF